jgi:hypothetical protein
MTSLSVDSLGVVSDSVNVVSSSWFSDPTITPISDKILVQQLFNFSTTGSSAELVVIRFIASSVMDTSILSGTEAPGFSPSPAQPGNPTDRDMSANPSLTNGHRAAAIGAGTRPISDEPAGNANRIIGDPYRTSTKSGGHSEGTDDGAGDFIENVQLRGVPIYNSFALDEILVVVEPWQLMAPIHIPRDISIRLLLSGGVTSRWSSTT